MRMYNVQVNADLVDCIYPDMQDWQSFHDTMHQVLLVEYTLRLTGNIPTAVEGRGHAGKIWDFLE